jgi:predicted CxxxxCH...CXXCH cytochrome family protein
LRLRATMLICLISGCAAWPVSDGRRCGSASACEAIHPAGIADPASADFHGKLLQANGWSFAECQTCHGSDFAGGTSGKSCLKCHADGPTSCTTCHALPPDSGAHKAHAAKYDCSECHVVPARYTDAGHLFTSDGKVIARATITFGALARSSGAEPAWDGRSCSRTYCHIDNKPLWAGGPGQAACGSCHAIPPPDHARSRCAECHPRVADDSARIINDSLHVDGKISLGDDSGTCQACHSDAGLDGAHASHLQARHKLRAPLACADCHLVPATVTSGGHIDQPFVQLFPAGWSGLASRDGAQPGWDAATLTCRSTYCHGNGTTLGADGAPNLVRAPGWTAGEGAAVCGACHGIPPVDSAHAAPMDLTACAQCHATTMNAQGGLIAGGTHLDGVIDHAP